MQSADEASLSKLSSGISKYHPSSSLCAPNDSVPLKRLHLWISSYACHQIKSINGKIGPLVSGLRKKPEVHRICRIPEHQQRFCHSLQLTESEALEFPWYYIHLLRALQRCCEYVLFYFSELSKATFTPTFLHLNCNVKKIKLLFLKLTTTLYV